MTHKEDEIRRFAKEAQASMAIEGYNVSDEIVEQALLEYRKEDLSGVLDSLIEKAASEGRSEHDVIKEYFDKKFQS